MSSRQCKEMWIFNIRSLHIHIPSLSVPPYLHSIAFGRPLYLYFGLRNGYFLKYKANWECASRSECKSKCMCVRICETFVVCEIPILSPSKRYHLFDAIYFDMFKSYILSPVRCDDIWLEVFFPPPVVACAFTRSHLHRRTDTFVLIVEKVKI